jgi:hypothetical protein
LEAKGVAAGSFQMDQGDPSKSEALIQAVMQRFGGRSTLLA